MKKILLFIFLLLFIALPLNLKADFEFDGDVVSAAGGKYQVLSRSNDDDLGYGLRYIRDVSQSSSTNMISSTGEMNPQVVNVLEVPSSQVVKVVNWSYSSRVSWSKQTVTSLAKDFERNNPGWIVLAGINGDFFDINGKRALPYQTTSACVCNGDVVRAVGNNLAHYQQIGITNDGSTDSIIGGKKYETNSFHSLAIFDAEGNITKELKVDKLNEEPGTNETSVYFAYNYLEEVEVGDTTVTNRLVYQPTTPAENSYLITLADRCYADSKNHLYAKGSINSTNASVQLNVGQFAVVTNNDEVKDLLKEGTLIRIQQNVIGDYANCPNITGGGYTLVEDSSAPANLADITDYRHPRTMIGQKEDGTIMLFTVDGRQESQGMYGMAYEEMTAAMLYYGCSEGYNLDGGGSTTIILRNEYGGFDVKNSPSDGSERNDSNAILVVVPGVNMYIQDVYDTSLDFYYNAGVKDITIQNVKATIEGPNYKETREMSTQDFSWAGLQSNTDYSLSCTYDIEYKGKTISGTSATVKFKTGNPRPTIDYVHYKKVENGYLIEYNLIDPANTIISIVIRYGKQSKLFDLNTGSLFLAYDEIDDPSFTLNITYNLSSVPSGSKVEKYNIEKFKETENPMETPQGTDEKDGTKKTKKCSKKASELILYIISSVTTLFILLRKNK